MEPRALPGVDAVLSSVAARPLLDRYPHALLSGAVRGALDDARRAILDGTPPDDVSCEALVRRAAGRLLG